MANIIIILKKKRSCKIACNCNIYVFNQYGISDVIHSVPFHSQGVKIIICSNRKILTILVKSISFHVFSFYKQTQIIHVHNYISLTQLKILFRFFFVCSSLKELYSCQTFSPQWHSFLLFFYHVISCQALRYVRNSVIR